MPIRLAAVDPIFDGLGQAPVFLGSTLPRDQAAADRFSAAGNHRNVRYSGDEASW